MDELILFRTHRDDAMTTAAIKRLQATARRRVVVVADQSKGRLRFPSDIDVIPIQASNLGLLWTSDAPWRCGDYAIYAGAEAFPGYKYFWLIESDVLIHSDNVSDFFDGSEPTKHVDFVTAWFVRSSPEWQWYETMRPFSASIYNCMLQLSRFSATSIRILLDRRRLLAARFSKAELPPDRWPNDEAFIGSVMSGYGLTVGLFSQHAPAFKFSDTFSFTFPTSARWIASRKADDTIYHPVVTGSHFLERLEAYVRDNLIDCRRTPSLQVRLLNAIEQLSMECGNDAADRFRISLNLPLTDYLRS